MRSVPVHSPSVPGPSRTAAAASGSGSQVVVADSAFDLELAASSTSTMAGNSTLALVLLAAWVTSGLIAAHVLGRRGHDCRPAAALGLVLGPLFIPLALQHMRDAEPRARVHLLAHGRPGPGPVDLLIGLAGPADTVTDVLPLLDLLGRRLGRVTVCRVIDFESACREDWCNEKQEAALEVELAAALISERCHPDTVLVPGARPGAFLRYVAETSHDLVVLAGLRTAMTHGRLPVALVLPVGRPSRRRG